MFSPSLFYDFKEGFKPISNFQNMIDNDDNSLIAIAIVAFVWCANADDWSFNKHTVGIKNWYEMAVIRSAA